MVVSVPVTEQHCPYCDAYLESASHFGSSYGRKFRRCRKCKKIYKTGRFLYSDLSPSQISSIKDETIQKLRICGIIFLLSFILVAIFNWTICAVIGGLAFYYGIYVIYRYLADKGKTIDKLKGKDKDLLNFEVKESEMIQEAYKNKKKDLIIINSKGEYELKSYEELKKDYEKTIKE